MNMNRRVVYIVPGTFILTLLLLDVLSGMCSRAHWTIASTAPTDAGHKPDQQSDVPLLRTTPIPVAPEKIAPAPGALPTSTPNPPAAGVSPRPAMPGDVRGIRGVSAAGLVAGLQAAGLRCSTPSIGSTELVWTCRRHADDAEFAVVLVAPATYAPPVSVSATVTQTEPDPSDLKAGLWLAGIATIPYKGASPLVAREWVIAHVLSSGETSFGDVRFHLSGSPSARTLDIVAMGAR
jgi:hypothetical protein